MPYLDAYLLLGEIYRQQGKCTDAVNVLRRALEIPGFSAEERTILERNIAALPE